MRFKRFRYNLIVGGLVAIVGCCVALPVISGGKNDTNQGTTINDSSIVEENTNEDEFDIIDEEFDEDEDVSIYEDMSAVELIKHSVDKLYNGKGYYSTYTQTAITESTGMTIPQYAKGIIVRSGKNSLQENYFYTGYSGVGSGSLKRFYQYYYVNRDNNTFTDGVTYSYDKDKMTYDMSCGSRTTMSYDEFIQNYCMLYGDSFPITTNPKKGDVIYSDRIDGSYRIIEVNYNVKNIPSCVKDLFGITGQLKNINYTSLKYTYKISLRTGNMVSSSRIEKISANATGVPVLGTVATQMTMTTTQYFKSVDEEQTIVEPGK